MRSFAILATIYASTLGTASALYEAYERTTVDVDANGYDERTSGSGCSPNGCAAGNTRDGDRSANSRWSCKGDILTGADRNVGCCITYYFGEPLDVNFLRIAFHKGNENTRTLDVFGNGLLHDTITSRGSTLGYQSFPIYTDQTEDLKICVSDPKANADVWLSIAEVQILVE